MYDALVIHEFLSFANGIIQIQFIPEQIQLRERKKQQQQQNAILWKLESCRQDYMEI